MFVDIFIIGAAAFAFYAGFSKGIIKTFVTTVGTIIALIATLKLTPTAAVLLSTVLPTGSGLVPIIAFAVTLVVAMLAIRIVGQAVESSLAAADLNFINKIAGGLLLAALGVFMLSCVFTFMDKASLHSSYSTKFLQRQQRIDNFSFLKCHRYFSSIITIHLPTISTITSPNSAHNAPLFAMMSIRWMPFKK